MWLPTGDNNTKYFRQRASQHQIKNNIAGFINGEGRWCTTDEEKKRVAKEYFQRLYTTANPNEMGAILDKVDWVVTLDMNQTLLQSYSAYEIK